MPYRTVHLFTLHPTILQLIFLDIVKNTATTTSSSSSS